MKKLWILLAATAIVSCKQEAPIDYALISGKITNADAKEMTLYSSTDRAFKHKITLAEDGSFTDTVRVAGNFALYQARNATPLHLKAGNSITVNFDAKDYKNTLKVAGKGSEISSYLVAKNNKGKELMGEGTEVYTKEEADYKKVFTEIKTVQENILKTAVGISEEFKAKEKRNINYSYLVNLNKYKPYHSYYAKKKDFEPSKDFLNELNAITYTSEEDFNFSSSYKSLVISHYQGKASDLEKSDDLSREIAMLKICASIENQTIKNSLIHEASKYNITYTDDIEGFYTAYKAAGSTNEKNNAEIEKSYNILRKLAKGAASPKFVNYENYNGGTTSLDDLKGKYVYIDVWATWCGPCKAQIPFLKKVEKQYHNKNIEFVSISVDVDKNHQKWKDMVKDKELGGIQLFADNDWDSQFIQDYLIKGIPKFILLDPQGSIVSANAPKPSDKELIEMFKELKI